MNIASFDVKFQCDSVNNGQVIVRKIYTAFLPVKYSRAVVTSFILLYALSYVRLTTVSLDVTKNLHDAFQMKAGALLSDW